MNAATTTDAFRDPTDWVATQARMLTKLAAAVEHAPLDALILALQQQCQNGFGVWLVPEQASNHHLRPATHLVEINLLGQQGVGFTVQEAAQNWRKAALATTTGGDAE